MIVDTFKINFYVIFKPNLYAVPITLAVYLYMIYDEVGLLFFAALAVIATGFIIQRVIDHFYKKANLARMAVSDVRGKRINEIISGIKIIKFNAWEGIFNKLISGYRRKEAHQIWKTFTLYNLSQASSSFIPTVLGIVTFSLYEWREGR